VSQGGQVKVSNISHGNGPGFGLWIGQRFIKPGEFTFMPVDELPHNYHTLTNVLRFEFEEPRPATDTNTLLVQQMLDMQKTLMDQLGQMQKKLDEAPAPVAPQIQYVQVAPTAVATAPTPGMGVGAAHFIPDIEEVQADIQVASTSSTTVDKAALMAKLKKAKK
jgi:hypothetical protein